MPAPKVSSAEGYEATYDTLPRSLQTVLDDLEESLISAADRAKAGEITRDEYDTFHALLRYTVFLPRKI